MNTWFCADFHFSHKMILEHQKRPFVNLIEHDQVLIETYNKYVKPKDTVYFLGDFALTSKNRTLDVRNRLNGNIYFIRGNHDRSAEQIKNTFIWFKDVYGLTIHEDNDQYIWLSHYAHRVWPKMHYNALHLFGHSHSSLEDLPFSKSMDVGVDAAFKEFGEFRPFAYEEVKNKLKDGEFRPLDHHR